VQGTPCRHCLQGTGEESSKEFLFMKNPLKGEVNCGLPAITLLGGTGVLPDLSCQSMWSMVV
jgi:hypothetical protein